MSVRLLTVCLAVLALLLASRGFAKPPDLPNKQKVTCTPPKTESAPPTQPPSAGPCNPAGAALADVLRKAAGSLPGIVPNVEVIIEVSPDADAEYKDILITVQETGGSLLFGLNGEEPTPERVHTGIGVGATTACDETACPHRKQQAEKKTECAPVEMSGTALENLERLKRAHQFYQQGEFYRRTGHPGAAAFCYESVKRLCPGSPLAARADVQVKAMLAAAKKGGAEEAEPIEQPQSCPYLNEKAACEKEKAAAKKVEMPGDPLSNINKLEKAEVLYRKAMFLQKSGRHKDAITCYEEVRRLCPGSRYADMAVIELKQIAGKSAPPSVETTEEQESMKTRDREKAIERALEKPLNVHWHDAPLGLVLDDMRTMTGLNIAVDTRSLEAEGYHLQTPIALKLEGVSGRSVLNLLLTQAHLAYVIRDEVVVVTTKSAAAGPLMTRTYAVADLIRSKNKRYGGTPQKLVKFITEILHPRDWSSVGGPATIDYYPLGKSIVVSDTAEGHEGVQQLLEAMRRLEDRELGDGEEAEPRPATKPTPKPKRKPAADAKKKVSQLLEQCHEALRQGKITEAAHLAKQARAIDADAVAADPFVYKMGLLDQVRQEVTAGKPFVVPPLPRFDSGVLAALQRLLVEMKESQTPSSEEEAEVREQPEAKVFIPELGSVVLKRDDADAVRFAAAVEELRSAVLDRMMTAVCAEIDHTRGPTRGRLNVQFGGLTVRAAWDAEGHGSMTIDVPAGSLLEWLSSMKDR